MLVQRRRFFKDILELHKRWGPGEWGRVPQRGPGAEPRYGIGGRSPAEAETHCRLL